MSAELQQQNQQLRKQLQDLVAHARQNEEKHQRFAELELLLVGTRSLRDLLQIIINNYRVAFELDIVTLALIDTEYELFRFLDETGLQLDQLPELKLHDVAGELERVFDHQLAPVLCQYNNCQSSFFSPSHQHLASIALIPLIRNGKLIGSLNLGSRDVDRFQQNIGTAFLERLAAVISVCIENAVNLTRIERMGMTDPLTRIYNRRFFEQRLAEVVASAVRYDYKLSCMFLDVDHFKRVNDELGHQVGDLVLQDVAQIISHYLRGSDIVARYGGEEFVVLLPQTPGDDAVEVAERIRKHLTTHEFNLAGGQKLNITISIGVAELHINRMVPEPVDIGKILVRDADQALLQAKEAGRDCVVKSSEVSSRLPLF